MIGDYSAWLRTHAVARAQPHQAEVGVAHGVALEERRRGGGLDYERFTTKYLWPALLMDT